MRLAKFLVALLVVGGAYSAPVFTTGDIQDFAAVIPMERVWMVVGDYLAYDKDVQSMLRYAQTDEFKRMIMEVDALPEFIEFLNSLEDSGFPAFKYWNIIHAFLGLAGVENPRQSPPQLSGGVAGLVSDVRALLNEREIVEVYEQKLKSNPRLRTLVELFKGDAFKKVIGKVASLPEVEALLEKSGLSDRD